MKTQQKIVMILVVLALASIGLIGGIPAVPGVVASQAVSSQPVAIQTGVNGELAAITPIHPYLPNVGWNS